LQRRYLQQNTQLKGELDEDSKQYGSAVHESVSPVMYDLQLPHSNLYLLEVQQKQKPSKARVLSTGDQSDRPRKRPKPAGDGNEEARFLASIRERRHRDVGSMLTANIDLLGATDKYGYSALHIAAKVKSNQDVICCLVNTHGMTVDSRYKNGSTPLHAAAYCEDKDNVMQLLDCGADPFASTVSLWLPVHNAANWRKRRVGDAHNQLEVIRVLMERMDASGVGSMDGRQLGPAPGSFTHYDVAPAVAQRYPLLASAQHGSIIV
jgi:ankyrin repeat protein